MIKMKIELLELFDYIKEYQKANGCPPSLREIMERFNVGSTATAQKYLRGLEMLGWVIIKPRKARGIKIVNNGR